MKIKSWNERTDLRLSQNIAYISDSIGVYFVEKNYFVLCFDSANVVSPLSVEESPDE